MANLKQQLSEQKPILGTFLKTPHYHVAEVLAKSDLQALCIDAEHAPYSRADLDANVLSCRANDMPVLIRVQNDNPETLLNALDIGATGVVVPHVKTAAQLEQIVRHCYYGDGGRGYAGSTRAAGYTTQNIQINLNLNKATTVVIAQLEDLEALENIEQICQVENVDCLFVGRMDLTIALGETDPKAKAVVEAVDLIVETANRYKVTTGMFVGDLNELSGWISKGVSLFLLSSDQSFMLSGAKNLHDKFTQAISES